MVAGAQMGTEVTGAARGQVAEVFRSFQGEGLLLGRRQVFVRLGGCTVGCRYCDTGWALEHTSSVAVPGESGVRLENPLDVAQVLDLVERVDPGGQAPVSLTGGEPLEQPEFAEALVQAWAQASVPREVMLETSGLQQAALARLAPQVRWVACDLKLPTATGRAAALDEHAAVLASGALGDTETFFKLIVDGDTPDAEVRRAGELLAAHAAGSTVYLQPVTPQGGSPALPRERLDGLADGLEALGLQVRVVPQVHKQLGVR